MSSSEQWNSDSEDDNYDVNGFAGAAFDARKRRAMFERRISTCARKDSFSSQAHVIAVLTSGGDSCGQF